LWIYRAKDVVEKGFLGLKYSLDVGRLRVHGDEVVQNKVFIGFVALFLLSYVHNVMLVFGLYKKWTLKLLFRVLGKHRVIEFKGSRIFFRLLKISG
jgi:transposase